MLVLKRLLLKLLMLLALLSLFGCQMIGQRDQGLEYVPGGDADRGQETFVEYGCGSCHIIPDVSGANSTVGPPLIKWADRVYIVGTLPNMPENLVYWLQYPQEVEPDSAMLHLAVTEQDARDMSAYLYTLR